MDFTYPSLEEPRPPPQHIVHIKPSVEEVTEMPGIGSDQENRVEALRPPAPDGAAAVPRKGDDLSAALQPASATKAIPQVRGFDFPPLAATRTALGLRCVHSSRSGESGIVRKETRPLL